MRPASLIAVAVSAVLGVALGVAGALALDRGHDTFEDPLSLGVPLRNQPVCDGKALLTVARGPGAAQLATGVTANLDNGVAYLDTGRSCRTAWMPNDAPAPRYVAYVGPFRTPALACNAQFSSGHRGGVVTALTDGATDTVQCLCFVQLARPTLHTGISTDGVNGIWLRQLQNLLIDMGLAGRQDATGFYDLTMATKIREFQRDNGLSATGVVDQDTWDSLVRQGCKLYSS